MLWVWRVHAGLWVWRVHALGVEKNSTVKFDGIEICQVGGERQPCIQRLAPADVV